MRWERVILLVSLAERLVGVLCLFLEKLQSPGQGLVLCAMLDALIGGLLVVGDGGLELLHLGLEQAVLVRQRGDFLLLGQVLLLERLDLGLELLRLGQGLVRLQAELVHFLWPEEGGQHGVDSGSRPAAFHMASAARGGSPRKRGWRDDHYGG